MTLIPRLPCAQCVRAARLLSARGPASASTSFAARSASLATQPRLFNSSHSTHVTQINQRRLFSRSLSVSKRRPREDKIDPTELPDADFDPTVEELMRGPDEPFDESQLDDPDHMNKKKTPKNDTGVSFYKLFPKTLPQGAPPNGPFEINARALHREFLQLQAAAHPDFHHAAGNSSADSAKNKARAEALSSMINEAYRTLVSPLKRAQYLLKSQYGIDLNGDEATLQAGQGEADLLMEVMEVREQIEWASSEEDLEPIREANDERMAESEDVLAGAFAANDIETARHEAIRLRYWVNVDEALKNWGEGGAGHFEHN